MRINKYIMWLFNNNIEKVIKKLEKIVNSIFNYIRQKKFNKDTLILPSEVNSNSYYINKENDCVYFVKSITDGTMIKYNAVDKYNGKYHIISGCSSTKSFNNTHMCSIKREEYEMWLNKALECSKSHIL